jgi:hypothetical protein
VKGNVLIKRKRRIVEIYQCRKRNKQTRMDGKNYQKGYHVGRNTRGVKEKPWSHDDLNVLQLDMFDRTVVKIAGKQTVMIKKWTTKLLERVFGQRRILNFT